MSINFFKALTVLNTASLSYLSFQHISKRNTEEKIQENVEKIDTKYKHLEKITDDMIDYLVKL
jgi:hypothetical protein